MCEKLKERKFTAENGIGQKKWVGTHINLVFEEVSKTT